MSIVEDQGVYSSSCGYCKSSSRSSVSQGMWAHTLTVDDYQELLNRGWRRSGKFLYKPSMHRTCCPPHSIRLDANAFIISKDQARVMRRMQRYLEGSYHGTRPSEYSDVGQSNAAEAHCKELGEEMVTAAKKKSIAHDTPDLNPPTTAKKKKTLVVEDEIQVQLSASIQDAVNRCVEFGSLPQDLDLPQVVVRKVTHKTRGKLKEIEGQLDYTSSVAFAIAAGVKRKSNMVNTEVEVESGGQVNRWQPFSSTQEFSPSLVAEILVSQLGKTGDLSGYIPQACKGHLNFLLLGCEAQSNSLSSGMDASVTPSYNQGCPGASGERTSQDTGDQARKLKSSSLTPSLSSSPNVLLPSIQDINPSPSPSLPLPSVSSVKPRRIAITIKQSSFDAEEFALYKKYQVAVHNDKPEEVHESSYRRFLVDSPLMYVAPENDGSTPSCGFGSFHQQYRIDGKLVAVGVVDILPCCLSSKYLFWDPDLAFLALGKYSALREIQWVQEANKLCPSLSFYYLGYYIHTCPKMRYKATYAPSELLCPSKYIWVPFEKARLALACSQYMCLSNCSSPNASAAENSAKRSEGAEKMEDFFGIEEDDEINNDASEADDDYCAPTSEDLLSTKHGLPFAHSGGKDESMEKNKERTPGLGKIILLLNNQCLTFERLLEMRVVPAVRMEALIEELILYLSGVGPDLASRMLLVPR